MVLLYELKNALTSSEFELSSLQHQYEALVPGKSLSLPQQLMTSNTRLGEIRGVLIELGKQDKTPANYFITAIVHQTMSLKCIAFHLKLTNYLNHIYIKVVKQY